MIDRTNFLRVTYNSKETKLTIEMFTTIIVIHQNRTEINGHVRLRLPFQNNDLIIRQVSTVFLEIRGKAFQYESSIQSLSSICNRYVIDDDNSF